MKKMGSEKKEAAPVPPLRPSAKADASASGKACQANASAQDDDYEAQQGRQKFQVPNLKKLKGNCRDYCAIIFYVLLGVITILLSIGVIVVTSLASVATKIYDTEQSSRLVAMIVLAVTAAIALSVVLYAIIGAFRKNVKPVHATGVVLIILAIIQALIIGLAIKITAKDEVSIGKSLGESFRLAKEDNPRHTKLWASTQSDLQCCGVYSPEDYRETASPFYFPPNIPISCCASYDSNKASYNQERQRQLCKVNRTYHENGCKGLIIEVFKETSVIVIGIIIMLIIAEVVLAIQGAYLNKKQKKNLKNEEQQQSTKN